MKTIKADVKKQGDWWVALCTVDDGYTYATQAKRITEIPEMIIDAAVTVGYQDEELFVKPTYYGLEAIEEYYQVSEQARQTKEKLVYLTHSTAQTLHDKGLTNREIAYLMHLTPARVGQLLTA